MPDGKWEGIRKSIILIDMKASEMFKLLTEKKKGGASLGYIYSKRLHEKIVKFQIKMKRDELGGNKKIHLLK